jgi:hypothetical protein
MKRQKSCGPRLGKLVHQLLGVVMFANDLRFRRVIYHWKILSDEYTFFMWQSLYTLTVVSPKNVV